MFTSQAQTLCVAEQEVHSGVLELFRCKPMPAAAGNNTDESKLKLSVKPKHTHVVIVSIVINILSIAAFNVHWFGIFKMALYTLHC